jgi:hypothetical protein
MNGVLVGFALAQIAEQQGGRGKQFCVLNKVVDHDPQDLEALIKLGRILLTVGRLDQALAASDIDVPTVLATERPAANDGERAIEYLDRDLKVSEKIALQLIKVQALDSLVQFDLFASMLLASGGRSMGCKSSKLRCTADGSFNADTLINNSIFTAILLFGK